MKKYFSTKSTVTILMLWFLVFGLIALLFIGYSKEALPITPIAIVSLVVVILIWVLLDTRYVIKGENLYYRSGPFRSRINIKNIKKMKYFSGLNVPVITKPALDTKGYIITTNDTDIFVSPEKSDDFINEIKKVNADIIIEN